jgi:hypothetical protein
MYFCFAHFFYCIILIAGITFSILNTVQELFTTLVEKGLALTLVTQPDWRTQLPQEFHCFAGNYHDFPGFNPHQCYIYADEDQAQFIALKLIPPQKHQRDDFFKAESYAKHLIGLVRSWPMFRCCCRCSSCCYALFIFSCLVHGIVMQYAYSRALFMVSQYCLVKTYIWNCV